MFKQRWLLILPKTLDVNHNIYVDKKLFHYVEIGYLPNIFRFWINQRSAIIGISQTPEKELYMDLCKKYKVKIVKRFTGGGTVYNDLGNLNWTFIIRRNKKILEDTNILNIYENLSYPIIEALKGLHLDVVFRQPTGIYLNGKKISGLAMRLKSNTLLCHGTLLIDANLKILNSILKNQKETVTNINNHTEYKLYKWDIMKEIIKEIQQKFKVEIKNDYEGLRL